MTTPLLEGLDGTRKMSKSYGNAIGVLTGPNDMFGKIMCLPDVLMEKYFLLLTALDEGVLGSLLAGHPRAAKDPVLDALPADAFPASLEVSVRKDVGPARLSQIAAQLGSLPAVSSVETYGNWTERLESLLGGGVTAAGLLALIVFAAVVSVVSSTIRLSLQRRKLEVEVMKLVGATDSYVRQPFVIEGAAQGAVGATLAVGLLGVLFLVVNSHVDARLVALFGVAPTFLPWTLVGATILVGATLGALAAFVSLRRFVAT
jgi:cell division transport system permease protein